MGKTVSIIFAILFLVAFSVQVQASRVEVTPTISSMGVCKLSFTNQLVSITNVGPVSDTYRLTSDNEITTFAGCNRGSISNDEVVLASGETALCSVFFNPFNETVAKKYNVTITAHSLSSTDSSAAKVGVDVLACNAVTLSTQGSAKTCARDVFSTTVVVKNVGRVTETYNLTADVSGRFDTPALRLEPGQSKIVKFDAYFPSVGNKKINFAAISLDSFAVAQGNLDVNVAECFTFDARVKPAGAACTRKPASFDLIINNTGTKPDVYTISAGGAEQSTTLPASGSAVVKLRYTPNKDGLFKLDITVRSVGSDAVKRITAESNVTECASITITPQLISASVCRGDAFSFPVTLRNTGKFQDTFNLTTNVGTLSSDSVTLGPGDIGTVRIAINASALSENRTYDVLFTTSAGSMKKESELSLEIPVCHSAKFDIVPQSLNVCMPAKAPFALILNNTGRKPETFTISALGRTVAAGITLQPNASRSLDFTANYGNESGIYRVEAVAKSASLELKSAAALVATPAASCYGSAFTPEQAEKEINSLDRTLQELQLKNTGIKTLNYMLQAIGPSWISVGVSNITLAPNETGKVYLFIAPPFGTRLGNYSTTVIAISEKGIPATTDFTASVVVSTTTTSLAPTTTTLPSGNGRNLVVVGILLAIAAILVLRYVFAGK